MKISTLIRTLETTQATFGDLDFIVNVITTNIVKQETVWTATFNRIRHDDSTLFIEVYNPFPPGFRPA